MNEEFSKKQPKSTAEDTVVNQDNNVDKDVCANSEKSTQDNCSENNSTENTSCHINSEVDLLKQHLSAKEEEVKNLELKILRLAADIENTKKRLTKDIEDAKKFSTANFAKDIINVYDILETSLSHINDSDISENKALADLHGGIKMTLAEMSKAIENASIEKIYPLDQKYDHHFHEAISRISNAAEIGTILQVVRPGYKIHGRCLRPAMVIVSGGE
jgi:molecular chaperone GrpE